MCTDSKRVMRKIFEPIQEMRRTIGSKNIPKNFRSFWSFYRETFPTLIILKLNPLLPSTNACKDISFLIQNNKKKKSQIHTNEGALKDYKAH